MTAEGIVLPTALRVLGTGSALPGASISTTELIDRISPYLPEGAPALALRLGKRLGITSRYLSRSLDAPVESPRPIDTAPKVAARAVTAALAGAACDVNTLRMLIGHTATPHTLLPANVAWVADELRYTGAHTELRQACTGFASATVFGASLIASGVGPVAIVGSETGSVMFDPRRTAVDATQLVNLVQMGDGAGAIVLGPLEDPAASRIELVFYGSIGCGRAPGLALNEGGSGAPCIASGSVPHFTHDYTAIREDGVELLRTGLATAARAGVRPNDIDWWLPHQVNGRLPELCARWLGLPAERVVCESDVLGNLGSAAIWVALDRLRRSGRLARGDRVLVLGAEATKYLYGGLLYVHGDDARQTL